MTAVIHHGNCREILATLLDASVHAIVTDPPYEIGFMGRGWDATGIAYDPTLWAECLRVLKPGGHLLSFGATRTYHRMTCAIEDAGFEIRDSIVWLYGSGFPKSHNLKGEREGWGTAIKPAHEPIVVARKPFAGTVADNVQAHGTGALNIDATRIATGDRFGGGQYGTSGFAAGYDADGWTPGNELGRWPANVILNEDAAAGHEWARYFYCSKASKAERNADGISNNHPTVKPVDLLRYLVRMITPPGGTILDPFAGSGTTMAAAILEGFDVIGCELTADYLPIIQGRIAWAHEERKREDAEQKPLFEEDTK